MTDLTLSLRFVREHGFFSELIDRGTGGFFKVGPRWSHVGTLFTEDDGTELEFGARSNPDGAATGGVHFRPSDYATFADEAIVELPVARAEHLAYWVLASKVRGASYSKHTIDGFLTGENVPDNPKTLSFDCSTLTAWLLLHAGADLMPPEFREELRQISPNSLYDIVRVITFYRQKTPRGKEPAKAEAGPSEFAEWFSPTIKSPGF